jgi:hypothetical protein
VAKKNKIWRDCQSLLPTKDNLLRREVVKDPFCPIYEREPETIVHALWGCPAAMDVWGGGKRIFQKFTSGGMDFQKVAEEMLCRCYKEDFALFVQVACQI